MLKSLAILGLLLAVAPMMPGQPNKAADQKQESAKHGQPSPVASAPEKHDSGQTDQTKASPNPPEWYAAIERPDWWLVVLGFATLGIVAWQTYQTKKAAEAALLNAQAVINAERALLLFTVEKERVQGPGGPSIFHISVVNYGKVPARRLEISRPLHATMTLNDFVSMSPPDYGDDLEEIQEWLAPKETWRVATFFPYEKRTERIMAAQNRGVAPETIEVIIYGQVTYHDGISAYLRHSRYCLAHDREPFSNIGGSLTPVGSEEYLECT
jgi:hypothetical protein